MLMIELDETLAVRGADELDAAGLVDVEALLAASGGLAGDFDLLLVANGGLDSTGDFDTDLACSLALGGAKLGGLGGSFLRTFRFIGLILSGLGASLSSFSSGGSGGREGSFSLSFPFLLSTIAVLGAALVVRPRAEFQGESLSVRETSSCVVAARSGRGDDGE